MYNHHLSSRKIKRSDLNFIEKMRRVALYPDKLKSPSPKYVCYIFVEFGQMVLVVTVKAIYVKLDFLKLYFYQLFFGNDLGILFSFTLILWVSGFGKVFGNPSSAMWHFYKG